MEFNIKLKDGKLLRGGYHELHNELFKNEVFNFILNWIDKKLIH